MSNNVRSLRDDLVVRQVLFSMTWYKTVTYLKPRVYVNNTTELWRVISV